VFPESSGVENVLIQVPFKQYFMSRVMQD